MSTLIAVYNSDGCVGRCDAKCYNATDASCDCICGGANHGKGLVVASVQTAELGERWLERYAAEKRLDLTSLVETVAGGNTRTRSLPERRPAVGWINAQQEMLL